MSESLTIRRPDDWHVHLRDGDLLRGVLPYTARQFARAIVMPNLSRPVTTAALAADYRERIVAALAEGEDFTPLMTCYLTDDTDPHDLAAGAAVGSHLADQLLLPLALAGGGSFTTVAPSRHTTTNIEIIRRFLDVSIATTKVGDGLWRIEIGLGQERQ